MDIPSFVFGGNTGINSPGELERNRRIAEALQIRAASRVPQNPWEGLNAVTAALASRTLGERADQYEQQQRDEADAAFKALLGEDNPSMGAMADLAGNDFLGDGKQAVINAMLANRMAPPPAPEYDWLTLPDGTVARTDATSGAFETIGNYAEPTEQWTPLSPEEATGMNLDPSLSWQRSPEGKVAQIGGSGVTVNVGEGSSEYRKQLDKAFADQYMQLQTDAQAAQRSLNSFEVMEQALSDPNFYSGAGGEQVAALKRMASAVGINPEQVSSIETFNAMSKQAALDIMGGSLGTGFSNADRDFVMDQVPNLGTTPEGNRKLIAVQRKLAGRKIEIAQLATQYANENGQIDAGFDDYLREWAEANPLFTEEEKRALSGGGDLPEPPSPGDVVDGYEFQGGDPADPNSWRRVR